MSCIAKTEFFLGLIKLRIISLNFQEWHFDTQKKLSTSFKYSKKDTSCNCTDTKQNCTFLPLPSDLFCVSLLLRNKNQKLYATNNCQLSRGNIWEAIVRGQLSGGQLSSSYISPLASERAVLYTGADPKILKRGGALYDGHHGWPTKKILGFRWSKKAKKTLETKALDEIFLSVFSIFLHFYI